MKPLLRYRPHHDTLTGKSRHRFLRSEALERRAMLAGDVLVAVPSSDVAAEISVPTDTLEQPISTERAAEGETTSTVHFRFDYTHDTGFFKNNPQRQALLEQAGRFLTDRLTDTLEAIPASNSSYSWQAHYTNPSTGVNTKLPSNFSAAANEIVVYVGTRNLQSLDASATDKTRAHADGINQPFSYSCTTGTQAACDAFGRTLLTRGEGTTSGAGATDFAPFVASISFDSRSETVNAWNFEDGPIEENQLRFLTFAQHELAHVLGHGISDSFIIRAGGGQFNGPKTDAVYVGSGHVPLNGQHIAQSVVALQPTIMTASIDTSELFSELDFAVLDDIGWQLTGDTRPTITMTTQSAVVTEGVGSVEVTATLSANSATAITLPVTVTGAASTTSDVQLSSTSFVFAPNQRTATITINVVDDAVDETTEAVTVSLNDVITVKQGSTTDFRLTIFDDDGVDWKKVPQLDLATLTNPLAIPGDNQARAIVFRAGSTQTLSVTASNVDQISEAVLLLDKNQNVIGQYGSTGIAAASLVKGEAYAIVFFPRLTARNFVINLPGGVAAVPPRTNVLFPQDVNGSGGVTEVDALQIINQLNLSTGDSSIDAATVTGKGYYDVSGDKFITAVDALQVINFLNRNSPGGSEPGGETLVRSTQVNATVAAAPTTTVFESTTAADDAPIDELLPSTQPDGKWVDQSAADTGAAAKPSTDEIDRFFEEAFLDNEPSTMSLELPAFTVL
ncbi:dockerin type I domain-containing protein [Aporhodopirellula aestuarii]|uniref:Dockerin type I domain-containing protein n=1 Tax=Aporhodopirellula aestuarii TaxID=2950107 RepID=A0ABT0UAV8_9BACT|nr:dockerin type I domain-containing protein [Aporhodopirellula aestuarii]MCM2373523.1 dockerin type I domain-containing protein [Aporhodopirellula aestuarii]